MRKISFVLLWCFILLFVGSLGCAQQTREIDNLSEYSLSDLRCYFEAVATEQPQTASSVEYYLPVSYNDAMQKFGDCVLRSTINDLAYTAYKVKEGGVYYVQWDLDGNGSPNECIDRMYLASLSNGSTLRRIRKGDPYSRLTEIDPNCRIIYRSAFDPIVYLLASNGKVYGFELNPLQGDEADWPVVKISDCTDKAVFPALLLKSDYPN